jgi:predicted PurR-regulated permease PerM
MPVLTRQQKRWIILVGLLSLPVLLLLLLGPILTPFIAGAILAYALNPLTDRLCSLRFWRFSPPRTLAVVVIMLALTLTLTLLGLIMVPMLLDEWPVLYTQTISRAVKLCESLAPFLRELGINVPLDSLGLKKLVSEQIYSQGAGMWRSLLDSARMGGATLLVWTWNLVLTPLALFYMLKDWNALVRKIREIIPRRWAFRVTRFAREVNVMLAQYLRGQLSVMLILMAYYSIALTVAGYNVAIPVGFVSGLLAFIPYIGITVGFSLAVVATLLQFDSPQAWGILIGIYGFGHCFDVFFMTPTLVGRRIQLHPLLVIFALLAFGQLFGFTGVLIALPSSAVLSVAFRYVRRAYTKSQFYNS